MSVLAVRHLRKSYKKGFIPRTQTVLHDVNFSLKAGTITGFLGGNGAGKTTTLKCVLGLSFPDSGEISFFDGQPLSSQTKARIGFLPERPYFYDYLTGKEFLRFYGQISTSLSNKDLDLKIDHLLRRVDLLHAKDRRLRAYSKGMLQKIGLAQALIHDPELLILDEPKSGLDPDGRYYLSELIKEIAKSGTSVFFSSHLLNDAETLCENLVILAAGKVVFEGKTEDLLNKMGQVTELIYFSKGQRKIEQIKDSMELQKRIDSVRGERSEIQEIRKHRMSLEEAFVKIALRGEKL